MNRVFVTGATGFLGAALVRRLVQHGIPTAALLRPKSNPWRLGRCVDNLTLIHGAFNKPDEYADALARFGPDTVFHLAWHGVSRSERDSPEQVRVNVLGSVDLFLASVKAGVTRFVAAGSQAEYGPSDRQIDENHPTKPTTLYGAAKLAALVLLERLAMAHAVRLAWLRIFSLYGPRDSEDTMIATLTRQLLAGHRPAVTDGTQLWDYLYVDDAASAFMGVARAGVEGVFNVGAGQPRPLRDTIVSVRNLVDPTLEIGFGEVALGPGAVRRLEPVVTRLQRATGWSPTVSLESGLRETVAWHREQQQRELGRKVKNLT